ncbi:MAG: hypothetical protein IJY08_05305 [Clostridia bacterium]|nr:hypothetical protein [Clostridia bacterium]
MDRQYVLIKYTYVYEDHDNSSYGIAAVEKYDDTEIVVEAYPDLTRDMESVKKLVHDCNQLKLDLIHLKDVVEDFVATL